MEAQRIWTPPPKLTVSQWADRHRKLSAEGSAEPGQWRTDRAEYQRGIMDALSDPLIEKVVFMKSAQVGWTEILNNVAGYYISQDPSPILVVQPTVDMGRAWSTDRLAPMVRDTPILTSLISDPRSRDGGNTVLRKEFPGGHLTVAGANAPAGLASRPIRVLLCDEVDRYPPSAGTEGDPITLGEKRTTTYWNRKILIGSTPTISGASRIELAFDESDKRRFHIPCPHCDREQVLRWSQVRWTGADYESAQYHCAFCGAAWTDAQRWVSVRRGRWVASAPFNGTAGFHINELYSPWRKISQIVKAFLESKDSPELLKTWVNTALGETWKERGESPEWERLFERREPIERGVIPAEALILTAGVDVQRDRIEIAVWAWAENFRSWLIDTLIVEGDPKEDATWDELAKTITRDWKRESGGVMRITRAGVDTGDGVTTHVVYSQIRRFRHLRTLVAMKGSESFSRSAPIAPPTPVDVTEKGRKIRRGLNLYVVSVSFFKSELYGRLMLKRTDDREFPRAWVSLPDWLSAEHVKQLVSEHLVSVTDKRKGTLRHEWRKLQDRNEQLDMAVYARAALSLLGADRLGDSFFHSLRANRQRAAELENIALLPDADESDSAAREDEGPPLSPQSEARIAAVAQVAEKLARVLAPPARGPGVTIATRGPGVSIASRLA